MWTVLLDMLRLETVMHIQVDMNVVKETCEAALHQQGPSVTPCPLMRSLINSRKHLLLLLHVCCHPQLKRTLNNPGLEIRQIQSRTDACADKWYKEPCASSLK